MDKRVLVVFVVLVAVATFAQAGRNPGRTRRKVEDVERRWIFEDLKDISSGSGIVKRAVGRSTGAESNSKPARGKPSRRETADSPITYVKPITPKAPSVPGDPLPESSSTTTASPTDASSSETTNTTPETPSTPDSTTPATSATTAPTTAAATTLKPLAPSTKSTPNAATKPTAQATTTPASGKSPNNANPESPAQATTTPASGRSPNNAKPESSGRRDNNPEPSANTIPGVNTRSSFDDEPSDKKDDNPDKNNVSPNNSPSTGQEPKKGDTPDKDNLSPTTSEPAEKPKKDDNPDKNDVSPSASRPVQESRIGETPDKNNVFPNVPQPGQGTFHVPQVDPWFAPRPGMGFGYPSYDPSANAGNFAWTSSGPSSAGASAGAFASAGAVAGAGSSGFSGAAVFPGSNQGPPAYVPYNNPAGPVGFDSRGGFLEENQGNQGYDPQGNQGYNPQANPGAMNGPGFGSANYPNQGGLPDNQVYPGYYPNSNGFPGLGNYGGFPDNGQAFPGFDPNFGYFPNGGFGYDPFGFGGGAFPGSAHDMIRQIQNRIKEQQEAIAKQIAEQEKATSSSAWATASMSNAGGQIDPYAQTYTYTQTSPGNNFNYYPNYDTTGTGTYGQGGLAGGNGAHTAISSISVGPEGGHQAGQISPVHPGIVSRFGESVPAPSGNSVAVFSSSSSSTRVGPDGKVHSQKSATTGINDNGKVSVKTVHD